MTKAARRRRPYRFLSVASRLLAAATLVLAAYCAATSVVSVGPGRALVVRELGREGSRFALASRALVNDGPRPRLFLKQPKLPFLGIGYEEALFAIGEPLDLRSSFAFYTAEELTGRREDRDLVRAFSIEGTIRRVADWDRFAALLDVDQMNYESRRSPFARKYRDRADIVADQIAAIARGGGGDGALGGAIASTRGGPPRSLDASVEYWSGELISRRNFALALRDKEGLRTREDLWRFVSEDRPWYRVLGVNGFESAASRAKELQEYPQSVYARDLDARGRSRRYIGDEASTLVLAYVDRAYSFESGMRQVDSTLAEIAARRSSLEASLDASTRNLAKSVARAFEAYLSAAGMDLGEFPSEGLSEGIMTYLQYEALPQVAGAALHGATLRYREQFQEFAASEIEKLGLSADQKATAELVVGEIEEAARSRHGREFWELDEAARDSIYQECVTAQPGLSIADGESLRFIDLSLYGASLDALVAIRERQTQAVESDPDLERLLGDFSESVGEAGPEEVTQPSSVIQAYMEGRSGLLLAAGNVLGLDWSENRARSQHALWEIVRREELVPFFAGYQSEVNIEESDGLWRAAIEEALSGQNLARFRTYVVHEVAAGETLETIARRYGVSGPAILGENKGEVILRKGEDQERLMSALSKLGRGKAYEFAKDRPLAAGAVLAVPRVETGTPAWREKEREEQKKRDLVVKRFIFAWIEEHAPAAFRDFIEKTPLLDYLQSTYGIELGDLRLSIGTRSIFSNPQTRQVEPDFYDLYERSRTP